MVSQDRPGSSSYPGPFVRDLPPASAPPKTLLALAPPQILASGPRVTMRLLPFGALGLPGPIFTPSFKLVLCLCSQPVPCLAPHGAVGNLDVRGHVVLAPSSLQPEVAEHKEKK